jgi:signal peptidase
MKTTISRLCNVLATLIMVAVILVAGGIMLLSALGRKPMAILSGSMEPSYNVGGLVFIDTNVSPEEIAVGDVITFTLGEDTVVTHRVTAIQDGQFTTKGDANNTEDLSPVPFDNMVGRAWLHVPWLGYALMNLKTTKGFAAGALILAVLIVLFIVPVILAPAKPDKNSKKGEKRHGEPANKSPDIDPDV